MLFRSSYSLRDRRSIGVQPLDVHTIYPALSILAVRADEDPYFFLARVSYDVTSEMDEFAITWLEFAPPGQCDLFENNFEDTTSLASVICRVKTVPEPGTALLRLPADQQAKIQSIWEREAETPRHRDSG